MFEFNADYFQDEERKGFLVPSYIKKDWAASLKVLSEIDKACTKLGLNYFATSGTLLGAVRERGMIPWDDDLDIVMTRRDFDILEASAADVFPESYAIIGNIGTNPLLHLYNGKKRVVNSTSITVSEEWLAENYGFPFIAGVDVFMLDEFPRDPELQERIFIISELLLYTLNSDTADLEKKLSLIEQSLGTKIDRKSDIPIQIETLYEDLVKSVKPDEADQYVDWTNCSVADNMLFGVWDKDVFVPKRVPFETGDILIPQKYEEILVRFYGEGYMTPPEVKGYNHTMIDQQMGILKTYLREHGDPEYNLIKQLGFPV